MSDLMSPAAWDKTIRTDLNGVAMAGYAAVTLIIGGFGYWAATAPLAGAAVASGTIAATGRNVLIQHLEGGIMLEIPVKEGDAVKRGQTLVTLDDTAARTQLNRLAKQWITLKARDARLSAERDGLQQLAIRFDRKVIPVIPGAEALIAEQVKEFAARLARFNSETVILQQRVATLHEALSGLTAQKTAIQSQSGIVKDEAGRKQQLLDKGLTNRSEYTQLLRVEADLLGQLGAIEAQVATNKTQIIEAHEQIERLKTQRVEQAVTSLNEVRASLADVEEQVEAATAVLSRTVVKAPVDGIVVTSVYNAIGSVVSPGEKIMEVLPTGQTVLVDARLMPQDIDVVHVGQAAKLRLSALNARVTPEVQATVTHVSADRLMDQATQQPYYRALLSINEGLPETVGLDQLHPGMPVEAFIHTGERTFFEYLSRPIFDSFNRAFTEE